MEGPTLADRIAQGAIPLAEALPIAKQIAEALEAAHEAGVIHRGLKPVNIKVRDDGTVKVLDFGFAKALDTTPQGDPSQSPTLTAAATQMGMIMGTAAYMSPEQARGKTVDRRADIWSFGAVLFEMLSGRRSFEGRDVSETLGAVLRLDPDWDALPGDAPPRMSTLLRRCLEKELKQRVHDVADVRLAVEEAFETTAPIPVPPVAVSRVPVWQRPEPSEPLPRVERFALDPPPPQSVGVAGGSNSIAISPDGTRVVFGATGGNPFQLHVRALDEVAALPLEGLDTLVFGPFVSPDGAWVGFGDSGDATLKKVSIQGDPPVTISNLGARFLRGASWGADDMIIFGTSTPSGLWRVPSSGGEPEELTTPDAQRGQANHVWPHILPGGGGGALHDIDRARGCGADCGAGSRDPTTARRNPSRELPAVRIDGSHCVWRRWGTACGELRC